MERAGTGGKQTRRNSRTTPYDRPLAATRMNNNISNTHNSSLLSKLVSPVSQLINAGAEKLFGAFRKRLPFIALPETSAEPRNEFPESRSNVSYVAETSAEPRNEFQESRSNVSYVAETSAEPRNEFQESRSNIFQEDIASPVELAKAFMGRRPAKVSSLPFRSSSLAPRHNSALLNSTSILPWTPSTSLAPRTVVTGYPNNLTTTRSRGRSAISNMPRTPYDRGPSTFIQKVVTSPLLLSSQPAWEHERTVESSKMAVKRRSSILDDFGSSGPIRRIRQKANLPSYGSSLLNHRSELVSSQKVFSRLEPESKAFKGVEENGETSKRNLGYASVPTESSQMDLKIFGQPAPRTAVTGYPNSLATPRSRGKSAMYKMVRTPYYRWPSTSSQKVVTSSLLLSSQPAWKHEGAVESSKMAVKRTSYVLDDFGSSGPIRRIRQKANLPSYGSSLLKHRSELVSSQKVISRLEPESKAFKGVVENGETNKCNLGYASVPKESSQMASKIFEEIERMSPKEKPSGSRLALGNLEKVDSPKFLPSSEDHRKSESQHRTPEATFQSKDKVEENGLKVSVSRNGHSPINRNSTVPVGGNSLIVSNTDSSLNLTAEPPQKKRAFQTSVHEDFEELNTDNHCNGHVSTPLAEFKKPATSVNANTDEPSFIKKPTFRMSVHEEFEELNTDNHSNGHVCTPLVEFKKPATSVNANKDEPSFINKQTGYNFHISRPSSSNSQPAEYSQSLSILDTVVLQEATPVCPTVGTSTESVANESPSLLSVMEPSEIKSNISPDAKSLGSTSNFNSCMDKDYWQFSASSNNDNGNTQKSTNMLGKAQTLISASPTTASTSGIFSFSHSTNNTSIASPTPASASGVFPFAGSTNKTSIANGNPASISSTFASSSSIPAVGSNANKMFSSSSTNNATLITTGSLSGFSSPAVASTTNESQLNTQNSTAAQQAVPVNFGSSSSFVFGTAGTTSSTSGSATVPIFGLSSAVASSEIKSGSSTINSSSNLSGSGFNSTPGFGLSSSVALSQNKSVGSTNVFTTTAWSPPQSSVPGFTAPESFSSTISESFSSTISESFSSIFSEPFSSVASEFPGYAHSTGFLLNGLALGNLGKVESPKILPSSEDHRKSESQHRTPEATFQSKDKVEENGLKVAVSRNGHSPINRNSTVPLGDNSLIDSDTDLSLTMNHDPPQKKRRFR